MEKEQTTIHRRQRRKPRFLWTVDLNLRSLRYLLFKIFSDLPTEGNEGNEGGSGPAKYNLCFLSYLLFKIFRRNEQTTIHRRQPTYAEAPARQAKGNQDFSVAI